MEKIFKQEDGSRVRVHISAPFGFSKRDGLKVTVSTCAKGKRKFIDVVNTNCYQWRSLSMEDRRLDNKKKSLNFVTEEQIRELVEAWVQENRPRAEDVTFN